MGKMRVLKYSEPLKAEIVEVEIPAIEPHQSLAKSIVTNVSAGTEMAFYRGTAPQLNNKKNPANGLWKKAENSITYPMSSTDPGCWWMGYACVAEIVETGSEVKDLKVGNVVFTHQGHKEFQIIEQDYYKLSGNMKPEHASLTMLTEICLNGILDTNIKLMDNIVVIGMGTLGQLLLQMCKLSGAFVIAVDFIDERLKLSSKLGADKIINPSTDGDLAENVFECLGHGADSVIEVSGNSGALPDAVRCVRKDGQITVLSFYQDPPSTFEMGREFHHNRTIIRSSQIGAINPALTNRYDRARLGQTALKLLEKMDVGSLISHRCAFADYPEMIKVIAENPSQCQSVVLSY